jgi:membrane-associated phospholipid phosphatase
MTTRAKWAFGLAAGCTALLALLWYVAFHVGFAQRADLKVFTSFYNLTYPHYRHRVHVTANFLVSLCDPSHFVYLAAVPVAVALARRRIYDAGAVLVLLAGAGATALVLKHVLPQDAVVSYMGFTFVIPLPRFPSGHSTAAMALALSLTFVVPARLRAVTAGLGAVFAATVGYSLLTIGSHLPTDVFAGFLVAAIWSLLAAGALLEIEHRIGTSPGQNRPISIREALKPSVVALLAILALAVTSLLSDPQWIVSYVSGHAALTVGVIAIAALSTAVSTGVLLSVRRDVMQ